MLAIQRPATQQRSSRVMQYCDHKCANERLMLRSSPYRLAAAQCATRAASVPHIAAMTAAAAMFTSRATRAALRGRMGSACRTVLQRHRCGAAIRHRQRCKAAASIARSCRARPEDVSVAADLLHALAQNVPTPCSQAGRQSAQQSAHNADDTAIASTTCFMAQQ